MDKHWFVHIVGRTVFDMGSVIVQSPLPLEVLDEWRDEGQVISGQLVARIKVKGPS